MGKSLWFNDFMLNMNILEERGMKGHENVGLKVILNY
jgi:hypothetical protein